MWYRIRIQDPYRTRWQNAYFSTVEPGSAIKHTCNLVFKSGNIQKPI